MRDLLLFPLRVYRYAEKVLAKFKTAALCGGAILLLAIAIIGAQVVADRGIALTIMGFGSFLSALVLSLWLPKLILENEGRTKEEFRKKQSLLEQQISAVTEIERKGRVDQTRIQNLEREIKMLSARKVDINSFRPILKLSILELDCTIREPVREVLKEIPPSKIQRGEKEEFLALFEKKFKAEIRVDLNKVRLFDGADNSLTVLGIASECQIIEGTKTWPVKRVERILTGGVLSSSHEVNEQDGRIADLVLTHETKLSDQLIRSGIDLTKLETGAKRMAQEAIAPYLTPLGKHLIFEDRPDAPPEALSISDYLARHNQHLDTQIAERRRLHNLSGVTESQTGI